MWHGNERRLKDMWNGNNKKHQITKDEEKRIDESRIRNGLKPLFNTGLLDRIKSQYIGCTYTNLPSDLSITSACNNCMFIQGGKSCRGFRDNNKAVLEYNPRR